MTKAVNDVLSPPVWVNGLMSDVATLTRSIFSPNFSAIAEWRGISKRFALLDDVFSDERHPEPLQHVGRMLHVAALVTATQVLIRAQTRQPSISHVDLVGVRDALRVVMQRAIMRERLAAELLGLSSLSGRSIPPIPLDSSTQVAGLKQVADTVTQQLNGLIRARPNLMMQRVGQPCNLRLLAHGLYADHTRAVELLRLNADLVNPALIDRGTEVQAYAQ